MLGQDTVAKRSQEAEVLSVPAGVSNSARQTLSMEAKTEFTNFDVNWCCSDNICFNFIILVSILVLH